MAPSSPARGSPDNKQQCIDRFLEWWPNEENLRSIINEIANKSSTGNSTQLMDIIENDGKEKITSPTKLASLLYDIVGPHFLVRVYGDGEGKKQTKYLRDEIFWACTTGDSPEFHMDEILDAAIENPFNKTWIRKLNEAKETIGTEIFSHQLAQMPVGGKWRTEIIKWLQLPPETANEPPLPPNPPGTEIVEPNKEYRPLHDYQIAANLKIRNMLRFPEEDKRLLISVPTGSGKTRMVVEALIDWLNREKVCSPDQQKNSKYLLWIAQTRELCEQAISEFKQLYGQKGESAISIHRLYGDNYNLAYVVDKGDQAFVVATINTLYTNVAHKWKKDNPNENYDLTEEEETDEDDVTDEPKKRKTKGPPAEVFYNNDNFKQFRDQTACIVIDEAHRAVSKMYTKVLRGMGFNFQKKDNQNENNIVLVGLTATAFRGRGVEFGDINEETKRMWMRFSEPYVPDIHDITERDRPTPIIDCPSIVNANTSIRISGARSFDNNSVITDYKWHITKEISLKEELLPESNQPTPKADPPPHSEIDYTFDEPGNYKIKLQIKNKDGVDDWKSQSIQVNSLNESKNEEGHEKQLKLIKTLINREILCEGYQAVIKGEKIIMSANDENKKNLIEITDVTKATLANRKDRNLKILSAIDYYLRKCGRKKILVFGCNRDHARNLSIILRAKYNIKAEYVDSEVTAKQRVERINQFKKGEIEVLCNVDILTTGFDVPDVDCVLIARPAKSTVLYTQMIGRGLRGKKMGGTPDVWLIDMNDQVQLDDGFQKQTIDLGWKQFAKLWHPITECKDKDGNELDLDLAGYPLDYTPFQTAPKPVQTAPETDATVPIHQCRNCGVKARGVHEIIEKFGFHRDDKALVIDLMKSGKLKKELDEGNKKWCADCRNIQEKRSSVLGKNKTKEDWVQSLLIAIKSYAVDWSVSAKEQEYFVLENKVDPNNQKRIFISYGNKEKEKDQVDVGIKQKAMNFLRENGTENSFVLVVNISKKSFVVLPFKILEKHGRFRGGENWDATGQNTMWFAMSTLDAESAILSNDFDCKEYQYNIKQMFEIKQASECPFCTYIENQPPTSFKANYQFVFGLYLINCQRNNITPNYDEVIQWLQSANPESNPSQFNPVFSVYESRNLIKIDFKFSANQRTPKIEITSVEKILDIDRFEKIIDKRYLEYNEKTGKEKEKQNTQRKQELDKYFDDVRNTLGYTPTSREFEELSEKQMIDYMRKLYGNYAGFLKSRDLDLSKELALRDLLYEEYFDLYLHVQKEISPQEIHEYKKWKIEDYEEVFGSFDELLEIVNPLISRIQKIDEAKEGFKTSVDFRDDYNAVAEDLGHKPHFDEMVEFSKIGMEYILNQYGTFERYKTAMELPLEANLRRNKLEEDYYKIKSELTIQPIHEFMISYSDYGSEIDDVYGGFCEFLDAIAAKVDTSRYKRSTFCNKSFSYPKSVYEEKQDQMIEAFRDYQSKNGIYQTIRYIHDDSQIKYEEWFGPDNSEKLTAKENFIYRAFGNESVDSYRKL